MIILGIDPGYERLGIAVIRKERNQKEELLYSECFKTSAKIPHPDRLFLIKEKISEVIKKYKPKHLSIETLFFNSNQKTALYVAESRGVIVAEAKFAGLKVFEYSPQRIKIAVTGYGKSDKNAVSKMIPLIIKINKKITHDDEYDAIAASLTCLSEEKIKL